MRSRAESKRRLPVIPEEGADFDRYRTICYKLAITHLPLEKESQ